MRDAYSFAFLMSMLDAYKSFCMDSAKIENIVGALVLALSDGLLRAAQTEAPANISAAGLTLIGHAPGITIHELSRGLGLSHPGAVRLVDRMVADRLVERQRSETDGRAVTLHLTNTGKSVEGRILSSRQNILGDALAALSEEDLQSFGQLSERLLTTMVRDGDHAMTICRMCDGLACRDCPVETELIARSTG